MLACGESSPNVHVLQREGSHRRVKRMLRSSGGLSLLRGKLGPRVAVDNHTIDDTLRREGWDPTK